MITSFIILTLLTLLTVRCKRTQRTTPTMLFLEPRQCVQGFKRLVRQPHHSLPALTEEDRL